MSEATTRLRGRRGQDRRLAEAYAEAQARRPGTAAAPAPVVGHRPRIADLAALPELLAGTAELRALAERYRTVREGRVGRDLRHVVYGGLP
ncbi:MAG TPA: hypothetical protein VFK38_05835, partial [Candidatus Limnocylindrales bacterium]|nr:hypothetical protein [Candidatus Limnocylindrales bacterium]